MKKQKYTVRLQQTVWEEIEIDASNYDDAVKIAEEKSQTYMGQGVEYDHTEWEVCDIDEGIS